MTEPNIILSNTQTAMVSVIDTDAIKMSYLLYTDSNTFNNWTDWANDSAFSQTETQKENASRFSDYVLKIKCELSVEGNACGMKSNADGTIMIASNSAGEVDSVSSTAEAESITYVLMQEEYVIWKNEGTPTQNLADTSYLVENNVYADTFFQFFYCGGSRDHIYTCYKFQPAVSVDGYPRFDSNSELVKAVSFIKDGDVTEYSITLQSALPGLTASMLPLVYGILATSLL